ncbi:MAG: pyruvate ferredoxin oxidoreductase [Candidatus Omnitrophica bacterium CG_4_9_14_0_2_um_filter_42_8]|nr:MAG: pyruvate ferredoxin oxidoreductase [Candidatus Omnitrophica bacterium CG_4_9_14_0_2_um_filter_42_8]
MAQAKSKKIPLTGDQAVATAMKQIDPDVVAAYPITPQTEIVMYFSNYVANGQVSTELMPVESEHSAMSACVGASAAGARTMTATSANGLALMWEIVYIAASLRLPIVMPVVNRALSGPINIHCDHSDTMGARDSGWIQIYCESGQEAYENTILAVRIAEHKGILLPVMVCQDGFITSHAVEGVQLFDENKVKEFVGEYKAAHPLLDVDNPVTYGPLDLQDYYFEHKRQQSEAMKGALKIMPELFKEFEKTFGAKYDFIDTYRLEDADIAVIALSSTAGTARGVIDALRKEGVKAGLLRPRVFRPFPREKILSALKNVKAAAVLDRAESFSAEGGPLYTEIKAALYDSDIKPLVTNYIYGLGGRDIFPDDIKKVYSDLGAALKNKKVSNPINYLGSRE